MKRVLFAFMLNCAPPLYVHNALVTAGRAHDGNAIEAALFTGGLLGLPVAILLLLIEVLLLASVDPRQLYRQWHSQ